MKRLLIYLFYALFALSCSKPAQPAPEPLQPEREDENGLAFAALSVINMREEPSYPAELGTQALMGTPVKVHYHDNDYWVNIETPDGYKAWVNDMAIVPIDQARLDAWKASKRVIVTNYYSFFVDAPRPDAQHVSDAVWGNIVEYVAPAGKYIKVKLPDGREAFIPASDVMDLKQWVASRKAVIPADAPQADVEKARKLIIETAKTFLGVPYLWAGTSIKGVDCSGFSKSVYFLNGYMLLRNASQQYKTGEPVDVSQGLDNLQPTWSSSAAKPRPTSRSASPTWPSIWVTARSSTPPCWCASTAWSKASPTTTAANPSGPAASSATRTAERAWYR